MRRNRIVLISLAGLISGLLLQGGGPELGNNAAVAQENHRVEVPFVDPNGNALVIKALLNQKVQTRLLVDTGANYTVITPRLAKQLHISNKDKMGNLPIMTANGGTQATVIQIPSLSIGGIEVHHVPAIVQALGNDGEFEGLLGMNFFKQVDFAITKDKLTLELPN